MPPTTLNSEEPLFHHKIRIPDIRKPLVIHPNNQRFSFILQRFRKS